MEATVTSRTCLTGSRMIQRCERDGSNVRIFRGKDATQLTSRCLPAPVTPSPGTLGIHSGWPRSDHGRTASSSRSRVLRARDLKTAVAVLSAADRDDGSSTSPSRLSIHVRLKWGMKSVETERRWMREERRWLNEASHSKPRRDVLNVKFNTIPRRTVPHTRIKRKLRNLGFDNLEQAL